jgi:hypothetical protein
LSISKEEVQCTKMEISPFTALRAREEEKRHACCLPGNLEVGTTKHWWHYQQKYSKQFAKVSFL